MTATPGQAARETFIAEAEPAPFGFTAWDELPDDLRGKWARIAQAAIAAQEPHAAPEAERDALEDIARAGQGSIDASIPLDRDWLVTRALEGLGWLPEGWPKEPKPAPELAAAMAETRHLRADLRTLADLWDASSSRDEESALRPNRAALVLEERATTRRQCAADIRKLAGLPS